jgi:hypothetical protein
MKKITLIAILLLSSAAMLMAWGVWGHKHISHAAVLALPPEMGSFFYNHIDFITEESVVPDIRKYTLNDKAEFGRHFIDIEGFDSVNMENIPKTMKEAKLIYDEKTFQKYGILPWYMLEMMEKLTAAMKKKRKTDILFLAGDLAHYLGDANMPLHTSLNHNGQLTGQTGIHGFWESQLPELFGDSYNFNVGQATYINDVTAETWAIVKHSHILADTLLLIDKALRASFDPAKMYKKDSVGGNATTQFGDLIFSYDYAKAYHNAMKSMVENQMRHAIKDVANFWYTAWVNAGSPNLSALDNEEVTKSNKKRFKKEMKLLKKGKLFGFDKAKEY